MNGSDLEQKRCDATLWFIIGYPETNYFKKNSFSKRHRTQQLKMLTSLEMEHTNLPLTGLIDIVVSLDFSKKCQLPKMCEHSE